VSERVGAGILDLTDHGLQARALQSAIDSTAQEKIQALVATFQKLKEEFDSRVGAQTLVTVQTDSKSAEHHCHTGS
jgi:hypothetical protein